MPINVNYRYVEDELRYLLDDADAKAVIFHREFAPKLNSLRGELPLLTAFVVVDDDSNEDVSELSAEEYEAALAASSAERDFGPRSHDDLYILYTGGTTGMPKGVMWRHEDVFFGCMGGASGGGGPIATPEEIAERATARTKCVPACPFMHGTAHWMAFSALYTGGTIVIPPTRHYDPESLLHMIADEQANFLVLVGDAFARPLVEAFADPSITDLDLSAMRVLLSGGAILSPSVKAALLECLPGTLIVDGYGASETGGQGQSVSVAGGKVGTTPRFRMNEDTIVLDDELHPAPVGQVGWLARRGHIPLGYYKDEAKSAATFPVVDGVRWSVPGDHAIAEDDGTITLLGRGAVSINTGGEKVYPEEVESVLKSQDAVFDAVVVGLPDARWGERVVAVVQARADQTPTLDDVQTHARAHLAGYKVPRDLVLVDHIVRSPSGKPDYRWANTAAAEALGNVGA